MLKTIFNKKLKTCKTENNPLIVMIEREEIALIAPKMFNLKLLHEAIRQAELKVQDENNRKERIDRRVYQLSYGTIFAIMATIPTLIQIQDISTQILLIILLIILGILLYCLIPALTMDNEYASLGRCPNSWLSDKCILENKNDWQGYVLAHILYDYQEAIEKSDSANNKR